MDGSVAEYLEWKKQLSHIKVELALGHKQLNYELNYEFNLQQIYNGINSLSNILTLSSFPILTFLL